VNRPNGSIFALVPIVALGLGAFIGRQFGINTERADTNRRVKEAFEAGNQYVAAKSKYCIVESVKALQSRTGKAPTAAEAFTFLAENMEPCNQKIVETGAELQVVRESFPNWNWPEGLKD
jgi:hypothetical protein